VLLHLLSFTGSMPGDWPVLGTRRAGDALDLRRLAPVVGRLSPLVDLPQPRGPLAGVRVVRAAGVGRVQIVGPAGGRRLGERPAVEADVAVLAVAADQDLVLGRAPHAPQRRAAHDGRERA